MSYEQKHIAYNNVVIITLSPMAQNYTVTGLQPTTTYTVELYASTQVGSGPSRTADVETAVTPGLFFFILLAFVMVGCVMLRFQVKSYERLRLDEIISVLLQNRLRSY